MAGRNKGHEKFSTYSSEEETESNPFGSAFLINTIVERTKRYIRQDANVLEGVEECEQSLLSGSKYHNRLEDNCKTNLIFY